MRVRSSQEWFVEKSCTYRHFIGFHDSEFCQMVLPCATGGLTLNIGWDRYGCGSILNFIHVYEAILFPTLFQCWPLKLFQNFCYGPLHSAVVLCDKASCYVLYHF